MANVCTLDEVRTHLRYPPNDTQDDLALQIYIDAADEALEKECGYSVPHMFDESYDGGGGSIYLYHTPVLSVESIQEGWGIATYELDYVQVNSPVYGSQFAYSIDDADSGYITRRTSGNINIPFRPGVQNIRVVYTAGRNPVPPIIKLAELELIAHWWQGSEQRAGAQAQQYGYAAVEQDMARSGPAAGVINPNQGIPWRIIEMIKKYRAEPIIG